MISLSTLQSIVTSVTLLSITIIDKITSLQEYTGHLSGLMGHCLANYAPSLETLEIGGSFYYLYSFPMSFPQLQNITIHICHKYTKRLGSINKLIHSFHPFGYQKICNFTVHFGRNHDLYLEVKDNHALQVPEVRILVMPTTVDHL